MLRTKFASFIPTFAPEDGSGGGAPGGGETPATPAPAPESVLFPNDGDGGEKKPDDKPAGDVKPGDGDDKGAADWKEYVPDPNKSEADNAAAKVEHDKTKPVEKKDDDKGAEASLVPQDGKYTVKMPEGIEVDQPLLDALGPKFAAKKLTNGDVQEIVDEFTKLQQARAEEFAKKPEGQWSMAAHQYFTKHGTPDKWAETAKADKEIGGTKWDSTVADARRAIDTFGSPALKEYFEASGGGNHPELIRAFAKAGALIKEDNPAGGDGGGGKPAEAAHVLFPNDAPKG